MKPFPWIIFLLLVFQPVSSLAEGWNFPSDTWGLGFGNSKQFTGLRFNVADKDVEQVNGWNFTLGVPIDGRHYGPLAGEFNGLNMGLLGPLGRRFNGVTLSPVIMRAEEYSGIMVSGTIIHDKHLRGLAASLILIDGKGASIDGVTMAGFAVRAEHLRGISVGLLGNPIREVKGMVFGGINKSVSVTGIQVGLWNRADELNGIQIGLLNYAGNNSSPFQYLPLFNAHFSF